MVTLVEILALLLGRLIAVLVPDRFVNIRMQLHRLVLVERLTY